MTATDTRVTDTAHRGIDGSPPDGVGVINTDRSGLYLASNLVTTGPVSRPDAGVQSVVGVVCGFDGIPGRGNWFNPDDRAERLLAGW